MLSKTSILELDKSSTTTTSRITSYNVCYTKLLRITGIASTTMYGVFYNKNISYVEFANSMTFIGDNAFSNNKITKLTVPNNIKHIGNNAFANSKIQELVLSNGLIYIGSNAFYYNNLENVTLPNSITVIST